MCGIFGFVSKVEESAGRILFDGLKKLEYRGYDSAGIAVMNDGQILLEKEVGKLDEFAQLVDVDDLNGTCGIAHTRWATHGGVTKANSHPQVSCRGDIAVVHNGIIENYQELRKELEKNHKFMTQTDTEVIPHLIEAEFVRLGNFKEAVISSLKRLEGSFALLIFSTREKGTIYAAKNESPLILGKANGKMFAASDAMPILKHTNDVIFLDDLEIAIIDDNSFSVFNIETGKRIQKQETKINWKAASSEKGIYEYYMLKEIYEQPLALADSLKQPVGAIEEYALAIKSAKGVMIIACGTALNASLVAQYAFDKIAGKHVNVINASEFPYLEKSLEKNSLVIAVSQSGETADVLNAIRKIKAKGALVYSIVNVEGSTMSRICDKTLYINAGSEIAVASTKAFTCQLSVLYQIAFAINGDLEGGRRKMANLSSLAKNCIDLNSEKTLRLAEKLKGKHDVYFIGKGMNYPLALEGALKMKEISYSHAEGMAAGELKHGALALIEKGTPVIAINPHDYVFPETISNAMETKARGAWLIGVSNMPNQTYDDLLEIPTVEPELYPILSIIPLQLLAYHLAVLKGHDPDKPRNLAKSVTVK